MHAWNWKTVLKRDERGRKAACISVAFFLKSKEQNPRTKTRKKKQNNENAKPATTASRSSSHGSKCRKPRKQLISANLTNQHASPALSPHLIHRLRIRLTAIIRLLYTPVSSPDHRCDAAQSGTMHISLFPVRQPENNRCSTTVSVNATPSSLRIHHLRIRRLGARPHTSTPFPITLHQATVTRPPYYKTSSPLKVVSCIPLRSPSVSERDTTGVGRPRIVSTQYHQYSLFIDSAPGPRQ